MSMRACVGRARGEDGEGGRRKFTFLCVRVLGARGEGAEVGKKDKHIFLCEKVGGRAKADPHTPEKHCRW